MIDPSQYGEGQWIVDYFGDRKGRFLDVGAFDGKTFSNTWMLAQLGWSGVCVEPSPPAFCHLMRLYADNTNIRMLNAALCPRAKDQRMARFLCNTPDGYAADAMSSLEQSHADKFAADGHPFREIIIPTVDWPELLWPFIMDDFLLVNIDTEGTNSEVLASMPFRPELICVEIDPDKEGNRCYDIVTAWGYTSQVIGGNLLAVRG